MGSIPFHKREFGTVERRSGVRTSTTYWDGFLTRQIYRAGYSDMGRFHKSFFWGESEGLVSEMSLVTRGNRGCRKGTLSEGVQEDQDDQDEGGEENSRPVRRLCKRRVLCGGRAKKMK